MPVVTVCGHVCADQLEPPFRGYSGTTPPSYSEGVELSICHEFYKNIFLQLEDRDTLLEGLHIKLRDGLACLLLACSLLDHNRDISVYFHNKVFFFPSFYSL